MCPGFGHQIPSFSSWGPVFTLHDAKDAVGVLFRNFSHQGVGLFEVLGVWQGVSVFDYEFVAHAEVSGVLGIPDFGAPLAELWEIVDVTGVVEALVLGHIGSGSCCFHVVLISCTARHVRAAVIGR